MPIDVAGYLAEQQRRSTGDLAQEWVALEELYNKKLWHQLTLKLREFVKNPALDQGDALVKLYQNFIADFEHRINPLALAEIIIVVSRQIIDVKDALDFLEKVRDKVKSSDEASVLCATAMGSLQLKSGNMDAAKVLIRQTQTLLDSIDGVTSVHGRFYELSSEYHKLMGNHTDYYRDALRFLGCIDLAEISPADQATRAFNIGLAAILGKDIYNFGELLQHPVLQSLQANNELKWIVDLMYAFNSGDIAKFEQLRPFWQLQGDLSKQEALDQMRDKMRLLCLMEMTFQRAATDRHISFADISKATQLPLLCVEHLVMRALSQDLIRGSIDEVDQKFHVTWVQPRVLDRQQIGIMKTKMDKWAEGVSKIESLIENKATDILV